MGLGELARGTLTGARTHLVHWILQLSDEETGVEILAQIEVGHLQVRHIYN